MKNIFSGLIQHTYEYADVTFGFMPNAERDTQSRNFLLATFIAT